MIASMNRNINPLIALALLAAAVLHAAAGCAPHQRHPYFQLSREKDVLRPGSMAVISGNNAPTSIGLAEFLTTELQTRSAFQVLSQEEISRRVPDYPDQVPEAGYTAAAGMKLLHEKLKTDYLFVVQTQFLSKNVITTNRAPFFFGGLGGLSADIYGKLFHCPDMVEKGNTFFTASGSVGLTTFNPGNGDNEAAGRMLQEAASSIVGDLLESAKASDKRGEQ